MAFIFSYLLKPLKTGKVTTFRAPAFFPPPPALPPLTYSSRATHIHHKVWDELYKNSLMSRGTAILTSILRSFRSISFPKTGNTLGTSMEVVRPPAEDMADGETERATFAMS